MKKQIPYIGLLIALAFILSYLESCIPFTLGIPGVKLGLANLVVLVAIYTTNYRIAFGVSVLRIVLAGFTFGNLFSMWFALAGGILSFLIMMIMKKTGKFSPVGVSVSGAVSHNIGQLFVAICVVESTSIVYYLPVLLLSGTIAGTLIGLLGGLLIQRLERIKVFK